MMMNMSKEEEVTSSSPSSSTTDDHPQHEELQGYLDYTDFSGGGLVGSSAVGDHQPNNNSWEGDDEDAKTARTYYSSYYAHRRNSLEEIVEEQEEEEEIQGDRSSLFSLDLLHQNQNRQHQPHPDEIENEDDNTVYVVVSAWATSASMDALEWTLNQPSLATNVCLVHVFPPVKFIPTPLGMMAASQVNAEQRDKYVTQETDKRRQFLSTFITTCSAAKVKVETILIESDMEAQAILDLVPIINITNLVLGTTKPHLRKMRSKGGNGCVVDQVVKGVPQLCDVKIICEGQQVQVQLNPPTATHSPPTQSSIGCGCFKLLR